MTFADVMKQLEKLGTAQNRKVYARHGAGAKMFGVSFANLYKLKQQIKTDHALARQLWRTCNLDAQWLATMIADPTQMSASEIDAWAKDSAHHARAVGLLFARVVARTNCAHAKMTAWMKSKDEFTRACGYDLLGARLKNGDRKLTAADCRKYLATIEKEIHGSPNYARHTMNSALIGIGVYQRALTKDAMAAAKRIGKVHVDHGETSCKTPDAVPYIQKTRARKG